jgi:hypothetical protein
MDAQGKPVWTETAADATVRYQRDPHASWARRAVTWLLQFLPIESQL